MFKEHITVADILYTAVTCVYIVVAVTAASFVAGLILTILVSALTQDSKDSQGKNEQGTTVVDKQDVFN